MALRFAIGIDLGTSNTALASADLSAPDPGASLRVFEVPQRVAPSEVSARPLLPSHLYLPGAHELPAEALGLPWSAAGEGDPPALVGLFAREQGARVPGRHVSSAKSWLCHPAVDRTARILPWGAPPEVPRISPVEASARILAHLRAAWDAQHPGAPLAEQDVVVTVPASFDEAARALTLQAAAQAGLPRLVLLEEPLAAFYDWTRRHRGDLAGALQGARLILVVDVGGGTTDLTPIEAALPAGAAAPVLRRLAVGDHLLLGGDNMDIALARKAEAQILAERGVRLSAGQWAALTQASRAAKERLLTQDAPPQATVAVPGAGSRLVGGAVATELSRDDARALLLDGFFPPAAAGDAPARAARTAGLAELGLPYAQDPAITRHIAAFLQRHAQTVHGASIDAVLYNGGALSPALLADRLTASLEALREGAPRPLLRLRDDAPDLAVARGAATYGLVRRGLGLRIGGGSPRTYYVGVAAEGRGGEKREEALCVVQRGAAEGVEEGVPGRSFRLILGSPVRFRLFAASGFRPEKPGDLVPLADGPSDLLELPPLQTVVEGAGAAEVALRAALTEIGTLEVWCAAAAGEGRRWKLEFELRGSSASRESGAVSALPRSIEQARESLQVTFGKKPQPVGGREVKDLFRALEKALGDRALWPLAVNRDLWGVLWAGAQKRRRSPDHERVFFSLCGYALRPGFGAPLDAWRVEQTWTLFGQGIIHHREAQVWAAWWILWRRIAAGLGEAEHRALYEAIAPHLKPQPAGRVANPGKRPPGLSPDEMVRLLGALERLPPSLKEEAGGWLLARHAAGAAPGVLWALGRLGARVPVAGAAHCVVPPEVAGAWLARLLELDWKRNAEAPFAAAQLARLSGDRTRDLDEQLRTRAAERLAAHGAPPEWARSIREARALGERDEQRIFGDSLPAGLHLA
ncbi:MAG: Hsp70 family protein [Myxococcales bacterium]